VKANEGEISAFPVGLRVRTRRRGTAIVETPKGILLVSKDGRKFLTPGGGAHPRESGQDAAIRELREETGMKVVEIAYLFDFLGMVHRGPLGGVFRNAHQVFAVKAEGEPQPRREIKRVAYFDGSNLQITHSARRILERYRSVDPSARVYAQVKCPVHGTPLDVGGSQLQVRCPYAGEMLFRDPKGLYRPIG
jgi:8-oxo-dGTP diphosphatase